MIAFSHYSSPSDISGVTTWLQDFLVHLRAKGEEASLNLHHFGNHPEEGTIMRRVRATGVAVSTCQRPATTEEGVRDDLEFLNRQKPSVYLPQCLPSGHFAAKWAAEQGLAWIFTLHSDDPSYWALADQAGPSADQGVWVAVSESIAEVARARYPEAEVCVIPYGVKVPKSFAAWKPEAFRVVYSGRIVEEQKRISKVIRCLIELCREVPHAEAVIIGDGPERARVTDLVEEAGLSNRIRFTGRLEPEKVGEELLCAQAILLMSDYEGLPMALLEAMSYGVVPVVRSIRSGIPEIVHHGQTGYLTGEDESDAVQKLKNLVYGQIEWWQVSQAARELIFSKYSKSICFAKWERVIEELKARSTPRYPMPIPRKPQLPPVDPRLAWLDHRQVPLSDRIRRRLFQVRDKFWN